MKTRKPVPEEMTVLCIRASGVETIRLRLSSRVRRYRRHYTVVIGAALRQRYPDLAAVEYMPGFTWVGHPNSKRTDTLAKWERGELRYVSARPLDERIIDIA